LGQTIIEKILAAHAGRERVRPGEIINAKVDLLVAHEVTTPAAVGMLQKLGIDRVFDADRIVVTPDHFVPNKDIQTAELTKQLRQWVERHGIKHYFELGNHGICHALVPEKGFLLPGMTVVCGDSHTCTMGAFGVFAAGIGSTDLAAAIATGELWFRVPETLRFVLKGDLPPGVYSKDIILTIIGQIGVDGALYKVMEYAGDTLNRLSMEARMTLTNMAAEAGAKTGVINPDQVTLDYLQARRTLPAEAASYLSWRSDDDAKYEQTIEIRVDQLEPIVAFPFLPSNTHRISEVGKVRIDQAYLGSCTNARIEDLRVAAQIMKGHKVAKGVRAILVPATTDIWKQANKEGLFDIFAEAGWVISTATCGACLGASMGVLGQKEVCISSTNRNFVGRMGHPTAEVYLASPATVAASAIAGQIADPRELLGTAGWRTQADGYAGS
jgi:3-isopropylmalate/(R)-2-methylmalate dehydratase large subunit